jgi:AcrR family transcriptional regulator
MIVLLSFYSVIIFIYIFALFAYKFLMRLHFQINISEALYLKNPEESDLGRKIIKHSIELIHDYGFEYFTFKKLAEYIGTTEAGIYRYFENKHRLLLYIVSWYWNWLSLQIVFQTNNIKDPALRLKKVINLLAAEVEDDDSTLYVNESLLHQIVISEGSKAYLTNHVEADNKLQIFKPYKDLSAAISEMISACNPKYKYPRSLATTIIEMAHFQNFFMHHLPSLTDFAKEKNDSRIVAFLTDLVFAAIQTNAKGKKE